MRNLLSVVILIILFSCMHLQTPLNTETQPIRSGAERLDQYLEELMDKKVGLCINHTSVIADQSLPDTLRTLGVNVTKILTPEHGFAGTADAGETIPNDSLGNTKIISLYGKNKKPSKEDLQGLDIVVFDMQDVGARFYTYISTMHLVMEACAENDIPMLILDRPNPNGSYIDGPVLDLEHRSFVGMHPIPVVHGMTVGELAKMINGEKWLKDSLTCEVKIVKVEGWTHEMPYKLPIPPSPNLPNQLSISLYPSLCLFEGTVVSVGRGTNFPFQVIGHPMYTDGTYAFEPNPMPGAKYPKLEGKTCLGQKFDEENLDFTFTISHLLEYHHSLKDTLNEDFFTDYFTLLAGTEELEKQIKLGWSEDEIRKSWQQALVQYEAVRKKYLLYP